MSDQSAKDKGDRQSGVPADKPFKVTAHAVDAVGNVEERPHVVEVPVAGE